MFINFFNMLLKHSISILKYFHSYNILLYYIYYNLLYMYTSSDWKGAFHVCRVVLYHFSGI